MRIVHSLLATSLLISCHVFGTKNKKSYTIPVDDLLIMKKSLIEKLEKEYQGGWIGRDCDGLLWNSLAAVSGVKVDVNLAEYASGKWHRRPAPPCYDGKDMGSKSTISNDMMTGLLYYFLSADNCENVERFYNYGKKNDWVMGEPYPEQIFTVVLRPNGRYLTARLMAVLCAKRTEEMLLPNVYLPVKKDYELHIQTVGMLLTADINGFITLQVHKRLKENAAANPHDALFSAAYGWFDKYSLEKALLMILDPAYKVPSYVRGHKAYADIHKLFVIHTLLNGADKSKFRIISE